MTQLKEKKIIPENNQVKNSNQVAGNTKKGKCKRKIIKIYAFWS